MGFGDLMLNVVTLGAHQRVKNAESYYRDKLNELKKLNELHEKRKNEVNKILQVVIEVKKMAIIQLRKGKEILEQLNIEERKQIDNYWKNQDYSLNRIDSSMKAGEIAISTTKGAVAGLSTALGAWAIVGSFGTASTGTAISTLSGAAASNAILAWLGGGSIAAGGGGIAAGTMVLGGLVAIPAIAITGLFQHLQANKKIEQLKKEELKIIKSIGQIKNNLLAFEAMEERSQELIKSIPKALEGFEVIYKTTYKKIYPFGFITKFFKSFKRKEKRFSQADIEQIQILMQTMCSTLKMVDSPVMPVKEA